MAGVLLVVVAMQMVLLGLLAELSVHLRRSPRATGTGDAEP
jgi:hypothetical protein